MLGITPSLLNTVHAEVVLFIAYVCRHKSHQRFVIRRSTASLYLVSLFPNISLSWMVKIMPFSLWATQVGLAITPAFNFEAAVIAGEFSADSHGMEA